MTRFRLFDTAYIDASKDGMPRLAEAQFFDSEELNLTVNGDVVAVIARTLDGRAVRITTVDQRAKVTPLWNYQKMNIENAMRRLFK